MKDNVATVQPESAATPAPRKYRGRLFLKYAGLFVAVVCVALDNRRTGWRLFSQLMFLWSLYLFSLALFPQSVDKLQRD